MKRASRQHRLSVAKVMLASLVMAACGCASVADGPVNASSPAADAATVSATPSTGDAPQAAGSATDSATPAAAEFLEAATATDETLRAAGRVIAGGALVGLIGAAEGAAVGGKVGIVCGPLAYFCIPALATAGAAVGGAAGLLAGATAAANAGDHTGSRGAPYAGPPSIEAAAASGESFHGSLLSSTGATVVPEGTVTFDQEQVRRVRDRTYLARLTIDLQSLSVRQERSYQVLLVVDCESGSSGAYEIGSYAKPGGKGERITLDLKDQPMALDRRSPPLNYISESICALGPVAESVRSPLTGFVPRAAPDVSE